MSQTQSQNAHDHHDSVLDPIIEELCRPIKDLKKNFEINISEHLAQYIDTIQTSVEINGEKINFSQAAMMLQGSVGCYSKKVDFLHQHSMRTLNMIGKDDDGGEGGGADGDNDGGGRRRRGAGARLGDTDFVFLDINIDKNTQKKDPETNLEIMSKKIGFIQITPREFIEKEGLDCGVSRIELYNGPDHEPLGYKQDFKMNSQFSMATATFGDCLYTQPLSEGCQGGGGLDETIENEQYHNFLAGEEDMGADNHAPDVGDAMDVNNEMDVMETDDNADYSCGEEAVANSFLQPEEEEMEIRAPQNISSRLRDRLVDIQRVQDEILPVVPTEDPWGSQDIYNDKNAVKSIVRNKKVVRLPKSLKSASKKGAKNSLAAQTKSQPPQMISTFINRSHNRFVAKKYPFLSFEIHNENFRKKQILKAMKKSLNNNIEGPVEKDIIEEDLNENEDLVDLGMGAGGHEDDPGAAEDYDDEEPDFEPLPAFECPDPHAGVQPLDVASELAAEIEEDVANSQTSVAPTQSYEDLVARMVAEFVQKSQAWMASSDMARKVQSWHTMIAPRLQAVEKRKAFDIHEYGSQILDTFPSEEAHPTIRFSQVAQSKRKEEVSRYFLATLMLANGLNVEIGSQGKINDMTLKFLSERRHHQDLHEFQAASQAGPSQAGSSQAGPSQASSSQQQ